MKNYAILCTVIVFLTLNVAHAGLPGETKASRWLQQIAIPSAYLQASSPSCEHPNKIVDTKILEKPSWLGIRPWSELWIVQACDKQIPIKLIFSPGSNPVNGAVFSVERYQEVAEK